MAKQKPCRWFTVMEMEEEKKNSRDEYLIFLERRKQSLIKNTMGNSNGQVRV